MAKNLTVDSADNSVRWYITPGSASTYDLQVHNDTDRAVLCRVTVQSHLETATVKPQSLTLQAHETRTVAVTFGANAELPRDRRAVITVKDAAGQVLNTIERELVSGASTDATITLLWKDPIIEDGAMRGFVLNCMIRSLSGTADDFTPDFSSHPALTFPKLDPIWLEPGATSNFDLPIRWDRAKRDAEGWNHPRAIEASVAVSQGRRSTRMMWDVVQRAAGDLLTRADKSPYVERRAVAPAFVPSSPIPATDASSNGVSRNGVVSKNGVAPKVVEPAKPVEAAKPAEVTNSVEPAKPVEAAKPVEPAKPVEAAKPVEPAKAAEPAKSAEPPTPTDSAKPQKSNPPAVIALPAAPAVIAAPAAPAAPTAPVEREAAIAASVATPAPEPSAPAEPAQPSYREDMLPAAAADRSDMPKSVRDVKIEAEKTFDGYQPAFQMASVMPVRPQTAAAVAVYDQIDQSANAALASDADLDAAVVVTTPHHGTYAVHTIEPHAERARPNVGRGGLWVAGGVVAFAAIVLLTRPHAPADTQSASAPQTATNTVAAAPVAQSASHPAAARPKAVAVHHAALKKAATPVKVAPTTAPAPTPAAQATPQPKVAQPTPAAVAAAPAHAAAQPHRPAVRRPQIDRSALPEIDAVDAAYGRFGRAVLVQWYSYAQAGADVQLTNARGTLIAQGAVTGPRSRLFLPLPRGYHGDVYIQVSVTGFHSERVVQTSSLPPF